MAKVKLNKSQLIREFREKHPTLSPAELAELINREHPSAKISQQYVYNVEYTSKKGAVPVKRGPKPIKNRAKRAAASSNGIVDGILLLKKAVGVLGKEDAKRLMDEVFSE